MKHDILIGSFSVLNAIIANKRKISKVLISETLQKTPRINKIIDLSLEKGISLQVKSQRYMDNFAKDLNHQGVICMGSPLALEALKGLSSINEHGEYNAFINTNLNLNLKKISKKHLWIGLEEIVDPRNLGAILRSCYFFGIDGVVVTSRGSCPVNATVSKTSTGAVELLDLYTSFNLLKFLRRSQENGWNVYGTSLTNDSTNLKDFKQGDGCGNILVSGNEGHGLSRSISRISNKNLMIKGMNADSELVDSLNVGVSAGILIDEFVSRLD